MHRHLVILTSCVLLFTGLCAQDLHFSQYRENPLSLNPALTGFFEGRLRATLNHRNQWLSIPVPYSTYAASIDGQLFKRKHKRDVFGLGVQAVNDVAGDSHFGTSQGSLSMAYIFATDQQGSNLISFGAQAGFVQRSIDYSKLVFDRQYNGSSFDPNLDPGEIFLENAFTYLDFNVGVNWFCNISRDFTINTGASFHHLTKPEQSLFDDTQVKLDRKLSVYASTMFRYNRKFDIEPMVFYNAQGTYTNLILGTRLHQERSSNPVDHSALAYGLFYRYRDALILSVNWIYKEYGFGISYDMNISGLVPATYLRGGYELSFSYILNPRKRNVVRPIPCPIFY